MFFSAQLLFLRSVQLTSRNNLPWFICGKSTTNNRKQSCIYLLNSNNILASLKITPYAHVLRYNNVLLLMKVWFRALGEVFCEVFFKTLCSTSSSKLFGVKHGGNWFYVLLSLCMHPACCVVRAAYTGKSGKPHSAQCRIAILIS